MNPVSKYARQQMVMMSGKFYGLDNLSRVPQNRFSVANFVVANGFFNSSRYLLLILERKACIC